MSTEITQDQVDLNEALLELDALKLAHQKLTAERDQLAGRLVQQEQSGLTVSLDFLKRVQESLSDYCGELDWGNADMDLMDEVEAMLAAAPKGEKP